MSTRPISGALTAVRQSVVANCHPQRAANDASSSALRPTTVCMTGSGSTSKNRDTFSQAFEWARPMNFEPINATLIVPFIAPPRKAGGVGNAVGVRSRIDPQVAALQFGIVGELLR